MCIAGSQNLEVLDREKYAMDGQLAKGAYTIFQSGEGTPDLLMIATGSEVKTTLDAAEKLAAEGTGAARPWRECCIEWSAAPPRSLLLRNAHRTAADTAEDDVGDRVQARSLFNRALQHCQDGRRDRIRRRLNGLR